MPEPFHEWHDKLAQSLSKEFPILPFDGIKPLAIPCPASIPMRLALQHNMQASRNHDRGIHNLPGLTPVELYYVLRELTPPSDYRECISPAYAIRYIEERVWLYHQNLERL